MSKTDKQEQEELQPFTVWAVQLLYAERDIEAKDAKEALEIARHQYQDTGELDPSIVEDGDYGVVGVEEFELWTGEAGKLSRQAKLAEFGAAALAILEKHEEWSSDTPDEIATVAQNMGLATDNEEAQFTRTKEGKL